MQFEILGRQIEINARHFLVVIGSFLLIGIAVTAISALFAFIFPDPSYAGNPAENLVSMQIKIAEVVTPFGDPISAIILLSIAAYVFKLKKDAALCRSLAFADFILFVVIRIAAILMVTVQDTGYGLGLFVPMIVSIPALAAGSILLYLWMLIATNLDRQRMKKAAVYALILAAGFFILEHVVTFFLRYSTGIIYSIGLEQLSILPILGTFVFSLGLLYFANEIKKTEAMIFAGLLLGSMLLSLMYNYATWGDASGLIGLGLNAILLLAIYLIGKRTEGVS